MSLTQIKAKWMTLSDTVFEVRNKLSDQEYKELLDQINSVYTDLDTVDVLSKPIICTLNLERNLVDERSSSKWYNFSLDCLLYLLYGGILVEMVGSIIIKSKT